MEYLRLNEEAAKLLMKSCKEIDSNVKIILKEMGNEKVSQRSSSFYSSFVGWGWNMDFYEQARKARESKKRIIYSNRESGAEQDFLFMISQRISQEIHDNLIKEVEGNCFAYNKGIFGRKIDFRYETSVRICFQYGNVNRSSFNGGMRRHVIDSSEGIVLYQNNDMDHSLRDVYYFITCYLSDTRDILFYILKILKKDFADIFIEATWGEECCAYNHAKRFVLVDGLLMTKSLIEKIMDKITLKDNGKVYGHVWFEITVEVPCDKKGNI